MVVILLPTPYWPKSEAVLIAMLVGYILYIITTYNSLCLPKDLLNVYP